jgi:hypothetical protein
MFLAVVGLLVSNFYDFNIRSASGLTVTTYDASNVPGERPRPHFDFQGNNPQYQDFLADADDKARADVPNFRDAGDDSFYSGSETPCFKVKIDPKVVGHDADYRLDMFGGQNVVTTEQFRAELETAMAESFTEEIWARDRKCFNGSFVVSFDVDDSGRLGKNMLVHHMRGSSSDAGLAVLDVLRSMDLDGHHWHAGDQPAGEARVPVSFRLE